MEIYNDFSTSVTKALTEIDPKWKDYEGVIVCGSHTENLGKEAEMWDAISKARENFIPFLGICHGHQLAAQEYASNVLGQHYSPLRKLPELKVGLHDGETYWNYYEVIEGFNDLWKKPEWFFTCHYHPEYQSSKEKPHPLLVKFLDYAKSAAY